MKKLNFEKMSKINGGKFFGNATKCTGCFQGLQVCHETFYVVFIPFRKDPSTQAC